MPCNAQMHVSEACMGPTAHFDWLTGRNQQEPKWPAMILVRQGYARTPAAPSRAGLYQRHSRTRMRQQDYSAKMSEQELGEHRKFSCNTVKGNLLLVVIRALLFWASENIPMLAVCETTHEVAWLPDSPFLVVSTMPPSEARQISGTRGSFKYTTHCFQKVSSHALSISDKLTYKSIVKFGEEIMQKEFVFCYSFFPRA